MPRSEIILCSVRQMEMAFQRTEAVKWIKQWVADTPEHIRKPVIEDAIELFKRQGKTCHYEDLCLHIYMQDQEFKKNLQAIARDAGQDVASSPGQLPSDSNDCQSQDEHDPSTL